MKTNRLIGAGGAVLAMVFAAGDGGGARATTPPLTEGRIAFTRGLSDGGMAVYTVNPDGSNEQPVPLPEVVEDYSRAVWSHDGTRLLVGPIRFDDRGELLPFRPATVLPDGSEFAQLDRSDWPFDNYCTEWSPDDSRILCGRSTDPPGVWSISLADSADEARLTTSPSGHSDDPVGYSPDGARLAFMRRHPDGSAVLFVANADGTGDHPLTDDTTLLGHELGAARWSPDGEWLISATTDGNLVEIAADGSGIEPIELDVTGDYIAATPSYSPDGRHIVFMAVTGGQIFQESDLYVADRDGSNVVQLTDTPEPERYPSWGA